MKNSYKDITDVAAYLGSTPYWYDENGVPRFAPFHPKMLPSIYAREAVLYRIHCQGCGKPFDVAEGEDGWTSAATPLSRRIEEQTLHYGDPPNAGCCASGPTMNSEPKHVIEYWHRGTPHEWKREHKYDNYPIEPDWCKE